MEEKKRIQKTIFFVETEKTFAGKAVLYRLTVLFAGEELGKLFVSLKAESST